MTIRPSCCLAFLLISAIFLSGCGWVPQSQVAAIQAQNRSFSERTQAQLAEIENLKNHSRSVEDQLIEAEEELALLEENYDVSRGQLANLNDERERLRSGMIVSGDGSPRVPDGVQGRLARLARKYPSLHYDPKTGISKLDTDVLFDSGEDILKPGAKQLLDEFADVLQSPPAESLKIMVVGHTDDQRIRGRETRHRFRDNWHLSAARAAAVAKQLRAAGIDGDRMGLAGFGQHQPVAPNDNRMSCQQNRRVEIFVMSSDVPVVGMTETLTNLY